MLAVAFSLLVFVTAMERPRHVVLILMDDMGYGDVHYAGAEYPTPTIDALAGQGVKLNQSYVMQLCSPTRTSLLTGRYSYNIGTDGDVLTAKNERCADLGVNTIADVLGEGGVATAFFGKWDNGDSSWAFTPTCRGFDHFFGFWGAAEDYYLHGSKNSLDLHDDFKHAPQFRGEYSTQLFTRMATSWLEETVVQRPGSPTFLQLSHQAVHDPVAAPDEYFANCAHIQEPNRKTYCAMMQAVDESISNLTQSYEKLGIWNDTMLIFLSDNGGHNEAGGFNAPLRGVKATVWEGGIRSQTFVHWPKLSAERQGTTFAGLVHVSDWLPTVASALLGQQVVSVGKPFDGIDTWPAIRDGTDSSRTEMLLSMRDASECSVSGCAYPGQLAYRIGHHKLIYGHPNLRGAHGDECEWSATLNCWNGWGVPKDAGASKAPDNVVNPPAGLPTELSAYSWGSIWLFDIEKDPLEENDLSAEMPEKRDELLARLVAFNASQIDQGTHTNKSAVDMEPCGQQLQCVVPWLAPGDSDQCSKPKPAPLLVV